MPTAPPPPPKKPWIPTYHEQPPRTTPTLRQRLKAWLTR
jgi:hypothetical protein